MSDPSVIFLDEPTSGLDSFQAQNVMVALKVLARHGRTVITTIHQPRSDIYLMFDKLVILSKGKLMYFGNADTTALASVSNISCFQIEDGFLIMLSMGQCAHP